MRAQTTCTCKGYRFPHRATSGKCVDDGGGAFCGACGDPCRVTTVDFGIGDYEYCGARGVHRDLREVSACCEAEVFEDASLTEPLTH